MANIARFDPFNDLVDDLFRGYFVRPMALDNTQTALVRMKVDVTESTGGYVVHAEMPGVKKEDINVSIDGAQVTLAGEVRREKDVKEGERLIHTERVYGKVERSFALPMEIDDAKVEAKFVDGVLELKLPKKAAAARKSITIQ